MGIDLSSFITLLSLFMFLAMLFRLANGIQSNLDSYRHLPGPKKLPVIGNLHQLLTSFQLPHRTLTDLAKKYGPIMHLKIGEVNTVIISSPEAAKEVMNVHDITFANRPTLIGIEILTYKNTDIAFAPYSDYWRQLRKICTIELLSARRVQSFQPIREQEFSNMCGWIGSKAGQLINLTEQVDLTMCDIVMRASIGNKTQEHAKLVSMTQQSVVIAGGFNIVDFYPSINLFHAVSGFKGRVERLHNVTDRVLEKLINEHKLANNESKQEDLVDVLHKFNEKGHELYLDMDNIKAVIKDVFIGGIDTSSTTIDWAMAEMLRHPAVLKKAQDEVREVFNDKGFVDESNIDGLKYMKMVIKETMRLHPVAPLLIPRQNYENCEINGYKIPANTRVVVNAWSIGRDPRLWKDADSFIPERFLDNPYDYKGNNFEFIPFGAGRRICPGVLFGLANVDVLLAMLLYHFDWVFPHGVKPENVDMTETFGVGVKRKNPLYVIPVVRKPILVK